MSFRLMDRLRNRLFFNYGIILLVILSVSIPMIYFSVKNSVSGFADEALTMQIDLIKNSIESEIDSSLKSFYRATTLFVYSEIDQIYHKFQDGMISEEEAKLKSFQLLSIARLGETGYGFIMNGNGEILYHPEKKYTGSLVPNSDVIQTVINNGENFANYLWQNSDTGEEKRKLLYSKYFEPWDWYICITGYYKELKTLVSFADFEDNVLSIMLGESGYPVVMDYNGTLIVHPVLKGENLSIRNDSMGDVFRKTTEIRNGRIEYLWKNPGEEVFRKKVSYVRDIPDMEAFVVSTTYESEIYKPLETLTKVLLPLIIVGFIIIFIVTGILSGTITSPIERLKDVMWKASMGDLSVRAVVNSGDEVGMLCTYFNIFIRRLEENNSRLKDQIEVNSRISEELRVSIDNLKDARRHLIEEERFSNMGRLLSKFAQLLNEPILEAWDDLIIMEDEINSGESSERISRLISHMENSLKKGVKLINSFKLFQIESDECSIKSIDVKKYLMANYYSNWIGRIKEEISIALDIDPDYSIKTHPELLVYILDQLTANSIIHSFRDGGSGSISIRIEDISNNTVIIYKDNGIGMSRDEAENYFEPLWINDTQSNGLGLNIVHSLVTRDLKGNISYTGSVKDGASYRISLDII